MNSVNFGHYLKNHFTQTVELFETTFADSEGGSEGKIIGALSKELLANTPQGDIKAYVGVEGEAVIAAVIFTRLFMPNVQKKAWLLSPMAIQTARQGKGYGQALIRFGLDDLRAQKNVEIVVTYGDPSFYEKVGFEWVSTDIVPAPFELSMPHGWLVNSLTDANLSPLKGPSISVDAFNNPELW